MMNIQLLGLNHKSAPIEIREKAFFSESKLEAALAGLKEYKAIEECLILSTCNRTEIYVASFDRVNGLGCLWDFISRSMAMPESQIKKYFYILENKFAMAHLFQVAASLDSMIIGETQILGQVKDAYFRAREKNCLGRNLNTIFDEAIRVGKKVRTQTQIGKGAISTSTAAIELSRKIFESLEDKKVLIIGAGKIGELTVKNLSSRGIKTVIVANRTLIKAQELAERFCGEAIKFENIFDYMRLSDIIISSTSAPHFVITAADAAKVMRARNNAPLFLIDLGLPRNIDPAANAIENVYLYNIDDLAQVCDANLNQRRSEAQKAQQIVDSCVELALKKMNLGGTRQEESIIK
ncbi:MAG: glutamyl-tRNA reductase [Candidatus Omnitrophica bacterium]|nr:glutamyl-tRNA reductase [Candidatus Omnitrophota bacterium]